MRKRFSGKKWNNRISSTKRLHSSNPGIAVPLFVAIISVLVLGGLVLADRSIQAFLGIAFQNQAWEAREAAEIGMAHFVGELNRPRNRGLLVKRSNTVDDTGLWGINAPESGMNGIPLSNRFNPCLDQTNTNNSPTLSSIDPLADRTYAPWYIAENGSISSSNSGEKRRFRLIDIRRTASDDKDVDATNTNYLRLFSNRPQADGRRMVIQVRGESIRNNKVVSSIILEKEFELTPKCCGVPFGGSHGNLNYDDQTAQLCAQNLGMGMVGGAASSSTGSISINGSQTSITNGSVAVTPIYCLNTTSSCGSINGGSTTIQIINNNLPTVPTYTSPVPTLGVTLNSPSGNLTGKGSFNTCDKDPDCSGNTASFRYCTSISGNSAQGCTGGSAATVFNADVARTNASFPTYCATAASDTELHCQLSSLTIDNNNKMPIIFKVGTRRLRLYFPDSGTVVDASSGNGGLLACTSVSSNTPTCATNASSTDPSRVSLFGSASNTQTINLGGGGTSSLNIFAYFPKGSTTVSSATAGFTGILWSDDITSNGNVTWTIPGSGLAAVMDLMGMDSNGGNNPIVFDYVLRGTDYSRWIGG